MRRKKEKPAKHYTGAGYLKVGKDHYAPLYNKVVSLIPPPDDCPHIIDLGCGVGYLSQLIMERGYANYTGIDFSEQMIKYSQIHAPAYDFILMNLYDENLIEVIKNYRLFIITETLEHLSRDIEVIEKIPKGATIIGSVPNYKSPGHVRIFKNISEVIKRYDCVIDFDYAESFVNRPKKINNRVMILRGIKK